MSLKHSHNIVTKLKDFDIAISNMLLKLISSRCNGIKSGTSTTLTSQSVSASSLHVIWLHLQLYVGGDIVQGSTAACRYPAVSTFDRHKQLWPLHREDIPLEFGTYFHDTTHITHHASHINRLSVRAPLQRRLCARQASRHPGHQGR